MTIAEKFNIKELFDSHAHLAYFSDAEVNEDIKNAKDQNTDSVFNMGIDFESSIKVVQQAKISNNYLKPFVGIDPEVFLPGSKLFTGFKDGDKYIKDNILKIKLLIEDNKDIVIGIGETGIDHYHLEHLKISTEERDKSKKLQEDLFIQHLELAVEFNLPLSIHSRWAEIECLEIVKDFKINGIFHSYTGDYTTAVEILEAGWGLGINGITTFKTATELREIYKKILGKISDDWTPWDFYQKGIFFETDSPFLSPEGKRGDRNEPANISIIYNSFINFLKNDGI